MWNTHTVHGSPFPAVYAKWSPELLSFATSSHRLKTALSLVFNNDDNNNLTIVILK